MSSASSGVGWGLLGVVVGFLLAGLFGAPGLLMRPGVPNVGSPNMSSFLLVLGFFATLWIVLIAVAIRWLFNPRGRRQPARLADLPADFDDWHRRAHAQMDREAAGGTGGARP